MAQIDRRHFLKGLGAGAFGLSLRKSLISSSKEPNVAQEENPTLKIKKYNNLGKTGIKVSDIGFGAINYFNPNVLHYAYDLGINYFDTAEAYMRTMSEKYMGQVLKDIRQKVIISTKHGISSPQEMRREAIIQRIEGSLKRLQTDYIDISLIHQVSDTTVLENAEVLAAYDRLKKDGKVRFTGISTHFPEKIFLKLLEIDFCDVVLFIYNHLEGPAIEPLIQNIRTRGIGTIAMKSLAGNKQESLKSLVNEKVKYSQAALGWVLSNPHIDSCIITMNTFSHVEEYVAASGKSLDRNSLETLSKYRNEAGSLYCRVSCRECLPSCPYGVAINDVLRYAMYYEDYRMEKDSVQLYERLSQREKPINCENCHAPCTGTCPHGISIRERLIHAHRLLRA
jgi:aryl-alcohol dehydrogenase-like predicted oxidoreductase